MRRSVSTLPGSNGFYSPHWSPDGKYIAALTTEHPHKLMLLNFATQTWTQAFGSEMGYESWSRDGKWIYFLAYQNPAQDGIESASSAFG